MKSLVLALTAVILCQTACFSYVLENYGPFEPGNEPPAFAAHSCKETMAGENEAGSKAFSLSCETQRNQVIAAWDPVTYHFSLELLDSRKRHLIPPTEIDGAQVGLAKFYYADLNSDGEDDFIAVTWSGGVGLAALTSFVYIALSSENGYSLWEIVNKDFDFLNFIELNGDGRCQFIQTSFVYGEPGKDGKNHNYWVHSLLTFDGGAVKYGDELDERFPKWVWYSFKPNHKATDQLTDEQKERLFPLPESINLKLLVPVGE